MKIKAHTIKYDTDGDTELAESLPQELFFEFDTVEDIENELADAISDETGFCVFSCDYSIIEDN